jgi:hypothetical protein
MGLEVQQILNVLELPPSGVLNAQQHLLSSAVWEVPEPSASASTPSATQWRLSATQLHGCGLLLGRLTGWVERRLQIATAGLMTVFVLGAGVMWQYDQNLQRKQRERVALVKTLLPLVDEVQQLKAKVTLQQQVLSVQEAINSTAYDWRTLGRVLAHVPKGAAVQSLFLNHEELRVELLYPATKGVNIASSWTVPEATHPPLTEVPDSRQSEDKTVRVRYTTAISTSMNKSAP